MLKLNDNRLNPASSGRHARVRAWIAELNPDALLADGFEDAILGVGERCSQEPIVVYDARKCVEILMQRDGMSEEEATEFFEFNTLGSWVGENTPLFLWRVPDDDELDDPPKDDDPDEEPDDFPREVGP